MDLAKAVELPQGVAIRETTDPGDFRRIANMQSEVWGKDWSWLADDLVGRCETSPDDVAVLVAEANGEVVSAAWLVGMPGTDFGGLWGGSTLGRWRGQGIYRALVARRAQIAVRRGVKYLVVDASDDSNLILQQQDFLRAFPLLLARSVAPRFGVGAYLIRRLNRWTTSRPGGSFTGRSRGNLPASWRRWGDSPPTLRRPETENIGLGGVEDQR